MFIPSYPTPHINAKPGDFADTGITAIAMAAAIITSPNFPMLHAMIYEHLQM